MKPVKFESKLEAREILELLIFAIGVGIFFFLVPLKAQAHGKEIPVSCPVHADAVTGERSCSGSSQSMSGKSGLEDWLKVDFGQLSQGPGEK